MAEIAKGRIWKLLPTGFSSCNLNLELRPLPEFATLHPSSRSRLGQSATMKLMRRALRRLIPVLSCACSLAGAAWAQSATGSLELAARITPTAARPEPVRQFTFYVLTKSYAEIVKEVEAQNPVPSRDKFIEDLKLSPELKEWLKGPHGFELYIPSPDRL